MRALWRSERRTPRCAAPKSLDGCAPGVSEELRRPPKTCAAAPRLPPPPFPLPPLPLHSRCYAVIRCRLPCHHHPCHRHPCHTPPLRHPWHRDRCHRLRCRSYPCHRHPRDRHSCQWHTCHCPSCRRHHCHHHPCGVFLRWREGLRDSKKKKNAKSVPRDFYGVYECSAPLAQPPAHCWVRRPQGCWKRS